MKLALFINIFMVGVALNSYAMWPGEFGEDDDYDDEYIEYYRKIAKERHAQRKFIEENTRKVLIEKWKLISIYF